MKSKRRVARLCARQFKDHRYIDVFDTRDTEFTYTTCGILKKRMWFQNREGDFGPDVGREVLDAWD